MKNKMLITLIVGAAALLAGCTCQQRLQRLQRHCPDCFLPDTLTTTDTLIPPPIHILEHIPFSDLTAPFPITLTRPNYTLTLTPTADGLTLQGTATPDTIIRTIKIPVRTPVIIQQLPKDTITPRQWLLAALLALLLTYLSIRTLKK